MAAYHTYRHPFTGKIIKEYRGDATITKSTVMRLAHQIRSIKKCSLSKALKEAWKAYDESRGHGQKCAISNTKGRGQFVIWQISLHDQSIKIWSDLGAYLADFRASRPAPRKADPIIDLSKASQNVLEMLSSD